MYFAACWRVKWRLVVTMVGLVVMATGRCGWAGGVQPSAEPRFGVEGERHRMVLPLSAVPSDDPSLKNQGESVHVTLADLQVSATETRMPHILSASARGIREVVIRKGGVSINTRRRVKQARAFLLRGPPRLVVDVHLASDAGDEVKTGAQEKAAAKNAHSPTRIEDTRGTVTNPDGEESTEVKRASTRAPVKEANTATPEPESAKTAGSADPAPLKRRRVETAGSRQGYRLGSVNGRPMIWPDLDAGFYLSAGNAGVTEEFVTPRRTALLRWRHKPARSGEGTIQGLDGQEEPEAPISGALPKHAPAAAHFLDADLEYVRAANSGQNFLSAITLYRRAVRLGPSFPDRDRGSLMIGFAQLAMGFGVEAESWLSQLPDGSGDPSVAGLAYLGAGRGSRLARDNEQAARWLRRAIAWGAQSDGACRARADLGVILAESRRGKEALTQFDEILTLCPAYVARAPRVLLDRAGVLAAAGRAREAEELLLALPELEDQLFVRQKFLEGEVAIALGAHDSARSAYEAVQAFEEAPSEARAEAAMRVAQLDEAAGRHESAAALLAEVALKSRSVSVRAKALATAAELLVLRGAYPEALRLLDRAEALGPAGLTTAEEVRSRLFKSWIASLAKKGDDAGILAVYYSYRGDGVGTHLSPEGVVRVASAASELGLPDVAVQVVFPVRNRVGGTARVEAQRILALAALTKGDDGKVLGLTEDITHSAKRDSRHAALARIRAAALLRLGRVDEAASLLKVFGTQEDLVTLGTTYLHVKRDPEKAYATLESALAGAEEAGGSTPALFAGWLAMADAADALGRPELAAAALRTAIRQFPDQTTPGMQYRLARLESMGASPADAAKRYATAAKMENDPVFARAAAADAAYFRALQGTQ